MTNIKVDGGIFILEAKNVTYKYPDGTVALDHINFKVNKPGDRKIFEKRDFQEGCLCNSSMCEEPRDNRL